MTQRSETQRETRTGKGEQSSENIKANGNIQAYKIRILCVRGYVIISYFS